MAMVIGSRRKVLTRSEAVRWIKTSSKGKIFGVNFQKRTTGALRVMVCRYGVRSHAKGIGLSFNPTAKQLIVVFDMQKILYRMINIPGMQALLIAGKFYKVRG